MRVALFLIGNALLAPAFAEQFQRFGDLEAHYAVISTMRIEPQVAEQHEIVRARDRALVNVALRDGDGNAVSARLGGHATNLLGQAFPLEFREVRNGEALYYLATLRHTEQDRLAFEIEIALQDGSVHILRFSQTLYVE